MKKYVTTLRKQAASAGAFIAVLFIAGLSFGQSLSGYTITKPAAAEVVAGGTQNYVIQWTGPLAAAIKTVEYSLDSGVTYKLIGVAQATANSINWNVPDTTSKKSQIRIRDANLDTGKSSIFTIKSSKDLQTYTITNPAAGEVITGGTQNYVIRWVGPTIAAAKAIEYSLDSGLTWKPIGAADASANSFNWSLVPDTTAKNAQIRITDLNGVTGKSGFFSIKSSHDAQKYTIISPAAGETIIGGMQNYVIRWTGPTVPSVKTIEYSLDSGLTWKPLGLATADANSFNWNVPDTTAKKSQIRITDANGITGKSGIFSIIASKDTNRYIVFSPTAGETIAGGTQNYQIRWAGPMGAIKTVDYSLDGGLTWKTVGVANANDNSIGWNVPDTNAPNSQIRVTDVNQVTGKSGIFSIFGSKSPGIVVTRPAVGEVIMGGTQNYQITWTGNGIAQHKTFEYSLDGGQTWKTIGTIDADVFNYSWNVPDTNSTGGAVVRITDQNGLTGRSGFFTITSSKSPIIIVVRPAENEMIAGGTKNYQIVFSGEGIARQKTFEYSKDNGSNWTIIGFANSDVTTFNWPDVPTEVTTEGRIRITDINGHSGMSGRFNITGNGVAFGAASNGYSIANYPNPTNRKTNFSFVLPSASDVMLIISDELGRETATVVSQYFDAGTHNVTFDSSNLSGGMYNYTLRAGTTTLVGRMIIVK